MAEIRIEEAAFAGFGLIGRKPVSVLMWGVAYMLIAAVPSALAFAFIGPDFLHMVQDTIARGPGSQPDLSSVMAFQSKAGMINPLLWLCSAFARGLLLAAVFRAVLKPEDKGFFYLRLSAAELWQALLYVCVSIMLAILMIVVAIAALLIGGALFFLGRAVGHSSGGVIGGIGVAVTAFAAVFTVIYVVLRLSLAGPMTFAEKQFRLFESWNLTEGHAGRLFLVFLLVLVVCMIIVGLFDGVIVAVMFSAVRGAAGDHGAAILAFLKQTPEAILASVWPWLLGIFVLGSFLGGGFNAIIFAPWAVVYRQLTGGAAQET